MHCCHRSFSRKKTYINDEANEAQDSRPREKFSSAEDGIMEIQLVDGGVAYLVNQEHRDWEHAHALKHTLNAHYLTSREEILQRIPNKEELVIVYCLPESDCFSPRTFAEKFWGFKASGAGHTVGRLCSDANELISSLEVFGYQNIVYLPELIDNWRKL